jgi:hypothetical protein
VPILGLVRGSTTVRLVRASAASLTTIVAAVAVAFVCSVPVAGATPHVTGAQPHKSLGPYPGLGAQSRCGAMTMSPHKVALGDKVVGHAGPPNPGACYGSATWTWSSFPGLTPKRGCGPTSRTCVFKATAATNGYIEGCINGSSGFGGWVSCDKYAVLPGPSVEIDWKVPARLTRRAVAQWGSKRYGLPPASYVDPADWKLTLIAQGVGGAACARGYSYRWQVKGNGISKTVGTQGCEVETTVPRPGVYRVTATQIKGGEPTGYKAMYDQVVVRDWLIVGLGDSNGSGEGNPPFDFPQCDRGLASSQYRIAQYLEDHDPRSSVTLLFAACSGARAEHLWQNDYPGTQPQLGTPLPPQITQVKNLIGARKADAVIMSIGINDLWFGPLMTFCVAFDAAATPCEGRGVTEQITPEGDRSYSWDATSPTSLSAATQAKVGELPGRYSQLATQLATLHPAHVFISEYPDFAHDENGNTCSGTQIVDRPFPHFYASTWQWLAQTGQALNAAVAATASLGWTPITGIAQDFTTHGYCSTSSHFRPLSEAIFTSNTAGAFHATVEGQATTLAHTQPAVCSALYGNPGCDGSPPAR